MADTKNFVKLALDTYANRVQNYAQKDSLDSLRQELIDMNGGSTIIDYRAIRDGQCRGIFTIIEQIIQTTVQEGYTGNEFFMQLVEPKNIALGDKNEFVVPNNALFMVSTIADGTQGLRRQRLTGETTTSITTSTKGVKIYEELNRVLAGRVDFNQFIDKVSKSFMQRIYADIYSVFSGISSANVGSEYIDVSGTYSEDALLEIISNVEQSTGRAAIIYGTKLALREVTVDTVATASAKAQDDMYNGWHYGSFHGTPMVSFPNIHVVGAHTSLLADDMIYVYPGDTKPIKYVTEGTSLILQNNPYENADLTQEYLYTEKYGVGIIVTDKFGVYKV